MKQVSRFLHGLMQYNRREKTYKVGVEIEVFGRKIYHYLEVKALGRKDALSKAMAKSKFATRHNIKSVNRVRE